MVELLAGIKGKSVLKNFQPALQKELSYWKKENQTTLKDGIKVFYYQDKLSIPRQESYREDKMNTETAFKNASKSNAYLDKDSFEKRTYQHLRAAAASGWDFSSRWFRNASDISTIRTADIIPVDLNCLLFHLESMANDFKKTGSHSKQKEIRTVEIKKLFFNDSLGWYCDYDRWTGKPLNIPTLAGMYPLFLGLADKKEVPRIVEFLEKNFLKPGGVVTTLNHSGEQWDAPNGWAPLQWITIIGLENYGYHELAKNIAERWCRLNKKVFERTGKLMEKYNVVDMELEAGGGEYPSQDGFGWTNGVLLALLNKYAIR
jgi:alpha,alpha-trehalase